MKIRTSRLAIIPTQLKNWSPYLIAILIIFLMKLPTINNSIIFIDEPAYLAQARRLDSLEAFIYAFQYRTETKFQLGLIPYILAQVINQSYAILIMRLFGLIALVISACLIISLSKRLFKTVVPSFFCLILWSTYFYRGPGTAVPLMEYFQLPFLLLALWLFLHAIQNPFKLNSNLFWSGISLGLAALIKLATLSLVPVAVLALLLHLYWHNSRRWQILFKSKSVYLLCLGVIVPILLFVLPYFLKPETLPELRFNLFQVTVDYASYEKQSLLNHLLQLLSIFEFVDYIVILTAFSSFFISKFIIHRDKWQLVDTYQLFLVFIGSFIFIGYAAGQSKVHYLIPILPFLLLFAGYQFNIYWQKLKNRKNRKNRMVNIKVIYIIAFLLFIILFKLNNFILYYQLYTDNGKLYRDGMAGVDLELLVSYVKTNSKPQDYIWVYYNAPELYWLSDRKVATNEPTGTWLTDYYNETWFDRTYQQLEHDRPALIIGINKPHYPRSNVATLTELPKIKNLLKQNYNCDIISIKDIVLCKLY
ncbi:MAG: hypothetical protein WCS37_05250 [Chloroflexota bacterium]|nr:hypothetical protein [Chloroflexota bacterium]